MPTTLPDAPLYRRLSADAFVRYDPAADAYAVVPADRVPRLAAVTPRRVRMSEGDHGERKAARFRRLVLSAMLEFQHKAHRVGSPESAQPYLDSLAKLLDDPAAMGRVRVRLSWTAAPTKAGGVKAVGSGEHAGRTLYGARAQAALRAQEARGGKSAGEVAEQSKKSSERAREIIGKAVNFQASKEEVQELAQHLPHLPAERLRTARVLLGASFGGGRTVRQMRNALMDHVRGLVDKMGEEEQAKPADGEPAPAAEPAPKPKAPKAAGPPKPGEVRTVPTGSLKVDPGRFQFKLNTDNAAGVTKELREVKTFNPEFAGVISVWKDPADGHDYVVNGHHRVELASRTGHPDLAVRYLEAKDAREARAKGALINIAEGRGTAVDAAKFLRDMGVAPEDLEKHGVSLKGKLAADAATLTRLNEKAFDRVARGTLDAEKALAVARHLADPARQERLFGLLDKREEEGKDLSGRTIEELARQMAAVPGVTKTESTLWGDETTDEDTFVERAELASHVRGELAKDHNDFAAVASDRRAGKVAGAGNTLNVDENRKRAEEAAGHKDLYDIHAHRKGPVADALDAAAVKYKQAKTKKERDRVRTETVESVRAALKSKLAEFAPRAGGAAGPDDGGGKGGVDPGGTGGGGTEPPAPAAGGGREAPADAGRGGERPAGVKDPAAVPSASMTPPPPPDPSPAPPPAPASAVPPAGPPDYAKFDRILANAKDRAEAERVAKATGVPIRPEAREVDKSDLEGRVRSALATPAEWHALADDLAQPAVKGSEVERVVAAIFGPEAGKAARRMTKAKMVEWLRSQKAPAAPPPTTKVGNSGNGGGTAVDSTQQKLDTTPVAQPPAPGGGGTGGGKMKSSVEAAGKKVEYDHPEPLANAAGAVEMGDGFARVLPAISDKMRAMGVTRVEPIGGGVTAQAHPTAGEGLPATTNKGKTFLTFANNPGLRELHANAAEITRAASAARSRVFDEHRAAEQKRDESLVAAMRAEEAEHVKKIPADHARVSFVQTGDADGIPLGRYVTEDGVEVPGNHPEMVRHGSAHAIRPGAWGAFDSVSVNSIPRAAVEKIKADKAAKDRAEADKKAAKDAAETRRVAEATAKARETGKPQFLRSWTESVDEADNSLNIVEQYVHPDGTTKTRRIPTH